MLADLTLVQWLWKFIVFPYLALRYSLQNISLCFIYIFWHLLCLKVRWYAIIICLSQISPPNISEPNFPLQFTVCLFAHHLVFPTCQRKCFISKVQCHLTAVRLWLVKKNAKTKRPPIGCCLFMGFTLCADGFSF